MSVKFRLLGPIEVQIGSQRTVLSGPQQRALLAMLVLNAGRVVSTTDLIAELWPGRTKAVAPNTLHAHVNRLRDTFVADGRRAVEIYTRGGYVLEAPSDSIDVDQFHAMRRRAAALAAEREPSRAATLLRQALRLWRGDALQDAMIGRRCGAAAAGLDESKLQAHEQLARLCITAGDPGAAVADLSELAFLHPMRETVLAGLMSALDACGRRAEALQVFQDARARFAGEYGAEPGQVMQQTHLRILQGAGR